MMRFAIIQSIILGTVQGVTEFLPISSSAHLIIVPLFLEFNGGIQDSLFFDVSLHFGTFLSVMIFFYKDWVRLIKGLFSSIAKRGADTPDERLIWHIIAATLPAAVAGVAFENTIDMLFHTGEISSLVYIAIPLTLVSFLMIFSEKFSGKHKTISEITLKDAVIIGCAQALALFPGTSRAGITICAGLLLGYKRDESAKLSFLLSTPVIFGAFLLKFIKSAGHLKPDETALYITGSAVSAIIGYMSIKLLLKFLARKKLNAFAYYRIWLAIVLVVWYQLSL